MTFARETPAWRKETNFMERERLEHYIERAVGRTQCRNVWGQSFGAAAMHELYAGKPSLPTSLRHQQPLEFL